MLPEASDRDAGGLDLPRALLRQIDRLGLSTREAPNDQDWVALLARLGTWHRETEDDRYLLERSLEVSSAEMARLYEEQREHSESRLAVEHARLMAVAEHLPIGIVEIDADGRVAFENPAWRSMCGRSLVDANDGIQSVVDELDRAMMATTALETKNDGMDRVLTIRMGEEGDARWARIHMRSLPAGDGKDADGPARWFVAASDVTDEVEARASNERLTTLLEVAADMVVVFAPGGQLLHLNRVGRELLGVGADEQLEDRSIVELFEEESRARLHEALPVLTAGGSWRGEATLKGRAHDTPTSLVLVAHAGRDGRTEYCSGIARDITELKEAQEALEREATHDALTGLPNRALLLDRLDQAVRRTERAETGLAVFYVDLDRFKTVNDSLGHEVGDRLIMKAAERLGGCVRLIDTVARMGGDEFVVIAEDVAGPRAAVGIAMAIVNAFNEPFDLQGVEAFVTASVGIAFRSSPTDTATTLLRDADVAMYRAKEQGRGRHEFYDAAMHAEVTKRFEIEAALRRAIDRSAIDVHYQPLVEVATGSVVGFEALARWSRGPGGDVPPSVFVPVAEETGLIGRLGIQVLEQACGQAASWNARAAASPLGIAVNVSARQLTQPGLIENVERILGEAGLDPRLLTLEITESVLVQDPAMAQARLEALRVLGVRIAIDDFGQGYSSLAYLQRFPLDLVKIDQVFVAMIDVNEADQTIVASIVELAHSLGLDVVAEGVERRAQLEVLARLGCNTVQGYVVSPAMPAAAASEWAERGSWQVEDAEPDAQDPVLQNAGIRVRGVER